MMYRTKQGYLVNDEELNGYGPEQIEELGIHVYEDNSQEWA